MDVTIDTMATDAERDAVKTCIEIKEHEMDELIKKIANKQLLCTNETHLAFDEYCTSHPEKEAEYRKRKKVVDVDIS